MEARIREHREKIERERQKETPDEELIRQTSSLSPQTVTLLTELGEECQRVLKLLAQLERPGLRETQVEAVLGELSAAVLHLHKHTRGLDEIIDEDRGGG